MKNSLKGNKWLAIVLAIVIIALGIVTIIAAATGNTSNVTKTICIIWAIGCFVIGLLGFVIALVNKENNQSIVSKVLYSGGIVGCGIFLCFDAASTIIATLLNVLYPWVLVAVGSALLIYSIVCIFRKEEPSNWIIAIAVGAAALTLGLIFVNVANMTDALYIIFGVTLAVGGLVDICHICVMLSKAHKAKK